MLYFTLNFLGEIKNSDLLLGEKRKKCYEIFNDKHVKQIFKNFKLPNVNYKLKLILLLIKYRIDFIYSRLFYK